MRYTTLFFDLDGTLYDGENGLWEAIRRRMSAYMSERMGLPEDRVPILRRKYYETYGTTLRGLQKHHSVDPDDYLAYVHDLPLENYLQPALDLRDMLLSLPQRKWIFTNADDAHARRVMAVLRVEDCFDGIIDVRALKYACKPEQEAYRQAMILAGEADPQRCVLLDDSPVNLAPARRLGFVTVLVGSDSDHPAATYHMPDLLSLHKVMPELWKDQG